ncbi:MAG: hypothetical protein LAP40_12225 [Acidobacteriia bacterium]|nr:hypothetical protein [Terriglobia bacterium]
MKAFFRWNHIAAAAVFLLAAPLTAPAQWLDLQTKGIPRTKDGKPDMTAPAPRKANGQPEVSGIWMVPGLKYLINIAADLKDVPFQPWAAAEYKKRMDNRGKDDPNNFCLPSVIPEKIAVTSPWKIVETPGVTLILYESRTIFRQIFTDGRTLPADPNPTWQGYSIGKWDGDTFVVETGGTNGKGWLDTNGHPVTDKLHVIERYHRKDFGHLEVEITLDDSGAYTKPWTVHEVAEYQPDTELIEYICEENNHDVGHFVGK